MPSADLSRGTLRASCLSHTCSGLRRAVRPTGTLEWLRTCCVASAHNIPACNEWRRALKAHTKCGVQCSSAWITSCLVGVCPSTSGARTAVDAILTHQSTCTSTTRQRVVQVPTLISLTARMLITPSQCTTKKHGIRPAVRRKVCVLDLDRRRCVDGYGVTNPNVVAVYGCHSPCFGVHQSQNSFNRDSASGLFFVIRVLSIGLTA